MQYLLPLICISFDYLCRYPGTVSMTNLPESMKGTPIALITAGLLAMAFMGFVRIV